MERAERPGGERERKGPAAPRPRRPRLLEAAAPPPIEWAEPRRADVIVLDVVDMLLRGAPPARIAAAVLDYIRTVVDDTLYSVTTHAPEIAFRRLLHSVAQRAASLVELAASELARRLARGEVPEGAEPLRLVELLVAAVTDAVQQVLHGAAGALALNRPGANQLAWSKFGYVRT
jgi:hypothetical protein